MAMFPDDMQLIDEAAVTRVALVIGPSSAAQAALRDAERLRKTGATPAFGYSKNHSCYVVFDAGLT